MSSSSPLPHIKSLLFFACFSHFLSSQPEILGFDAAFWTIFIFCYACGWAVLAFLAEDGATHSGASSPHQLSSGRNQTGADFFLPFFSHLCPEASVAPHSLFAPSSLGISFRSAVCIKQSLSYCLVSTTFFCSDR